MVRQRCYSLSLPLLQRSQGVLPSSRPSLSVLLLCLREPNDSRPLLLLKGSGSFLPHRLSTSDFVVCDLHLQGMVLIDATLLLQFKRIGQNDARLGLGHFQIGAGLLLGEIPEGDARCLLEVGGGLDRLLNVASFDFSSRVKLE